MSAIEATTVKCATLVDGTLRLTMDVEPGQAQDAFKLFGAPGRAVAIAAFKDGKDTKVDAAVREIMAVHGPHIPEPRAARVARQITDAQREAAQANWNQLGTLCKTAVMWCNVPEFQQFVGADNPAEASEQIKKACSINSRKELDTDPRAALAFRECILVPYQRYMAAKQ